MDARPNETSNKPPTIDEVFQPWELIGESRRDCEPHRGRLLRWLARISLLVGVLSFLYPPIAALLLFDGMGLEAGWLQLSLVLLPNGLMGFLLGSVIQMLARRDLDAMSAGNMDQRGYGDTEKARIESHAGAVVSLLGSLFWSIPLGGIVLCFVFGALLDMVSSAR